MLPEAGKDSCWTPRATFRYCATASGERSRETLWKCPYSKANGKLSGGLSGFWREKPTPSWENLLNPLLARFCIPTILAFILILLLSALRGRPLVTRPSLTWWIGKANRQKVKCARSSGLRALTKQKCERLLPLADLKATSRRMSWRKPRNCTPPRVLCRHPMSAQRGEILEKHSRSP